MAPNLRPDEADSFQYLSTEGAGGRSVMIGRTVSHCEVFEKLGEGDAGVV